MFSYLIFPILQNSYTKAKQATENKYNDLQHGLILTNLLWNTIKYINMIIWVVKNTPMHEFVLLRVNFHGILGDQLLFKNHNKTRNFNETKTMI